MTTAFAFPFSVRTRGRRDFSRRFKWPDPSRGAGPEPDVDWSSITTTHTGNQCSPSPAATVRSSIVLAPAYALGVHSAAADGVARSVERSRAAKKPRSDMRGRLSGTPRRVKVPRRIDSGARPSLTAGMARLPYVEPATAPEQVRELLERLALRFTTEVVRDVRASEATFAELARRLSAQEIVELIITVGYYMMIARLLETTVVDLDPPAGTKVVDAIR